MTCKHPKLRPEVFDQTLGVYCPDCGLAEWCWGPRHFSEALWNVACLNDPEAYPCEQSRDHVCGLCEEEFK